MLILDINLPFHRHVNMDFWPGFCAKAGVFCMGEVFSGDTQPEYVSLRLLFHHPQFCAT